MSALARATIPWPGIDSEGHSVTESQFEISRPPSVHQTPRRCPGRKITMHWCKQGVEMILADEKSIGGQLGRPSGARFRTFERLKRFVEDNGILYGSHRNCARQSMIFTVTRCEMAAKDALNRQLRSGVEGQQLAELVVSLRAEDRTVRGRRRNRSPTNRRLFVRWVWSTHNSNRVLSGRERCPSIFKKPANISESLSCPNFLLN